MSRKHRQKTRDDAVVEMHPETIQRQLLASKPKYQGAEGLEKIKKGLLEIPGAKWSVSVRDGKLVSVIEVPLEALLEQQERRDRKRGNLGDV